MEWMDSYRRAASWGWVAVGVLVQVVGVAAGWARPGVVTWLLMAEVATLAVLTWVCARNRAAGVLSRLTAVPFALDFVGAVLDRFGVLGVPGSPGVSWGSWSRFQNYTAVLLHHPGPVAVTTAAVGATAFEVALAVSLASGWRPRLVGKAAAGLFTIYLLAMAASPGADVVRYAVLFLIGGALLLSATTSTTPTRSIRSAPVKETAHA